MKQLSCTFQISIPSIEEIETYLQDHQYCYQVVNIHDCYYRKGAARVNQKRLSELDCLKNIQYFVYIKLVEIENHQYGLVAGRTNTADPDIEFTTVYNRTTVTRADLAKKIIMDHQLNWNQDELVIIASIEYDYQLLCRIEKELQNDLHLSGS